MRNDLLNPTINKILSVFGLDKTYTKGQGTLLYDAEGNCYLDFISQYGAVPFGYNPDFIWQALDEVREKAVPSFVQPSIPEQAVQLANMLADVTPGDLCYATFSQSGTEAVEAAIKLARSSSGREMIISTHNSFHGKTLGSLSATGKEAYQRPFRAPAPGFLQIPFNDIEALAYALEQHKNRVAAFIVEPIQGEGGVYVADHAYLREASRLCKQEQVVFILDEIQTGLGRTGTLFACEQYGIDPDILVLAKALGGGMLPLAVTMSSPQVWNDDFGHYHSSTFANNNLTCAVGMAVLEKLCANNRQVIKEVAYHGEYMLEKLNNLRLKYPDVIKEVRGAGLMIGVEFHPLHDCGSYEITYLTRQGGFTALLCGYLLNVHQLRLAPFLNDSMTLRLEPALIISREEIDRMAAALENVCQILHFRNYALLYRYLIGDNKPQVIKDYRSQLRKIQYSQIQPVKKQTGKFAFVIHYPDPEDIIANNPSFEQFSREELYRYMEWQCRNDEADICCHMPAITSKAGMSTEGWFIGIPYGARQLMELPRAQVVDMIRQAVDKGKELGAMVVGLGALTSVVTRGGRDVVGRGVAITSGNSFTTLMAMEALLQGARLMKIDLKQARGAVVGATGSIGRACSVLLSREIERICLLGNAARPRSSMRRLSLLAADILNRANQWRLEGKTGGISGWLAEAMVHHHNRQADPLREKIGDRQPLTWQEWEEFCRLQQRVCPITLSLDLQEQLPKHNLIVAASNSPEHLIFSDHLAPGTVVCDVARPADVSYEVVEKRNDVLVLEGGLVQFPDPHISFGPNLGYREGVNLACLSETILLALEDRRKDFSIGLQLPFETINYMQHLGEKHGFGLAGLMMGKHEINQADIDAICYHAQRNRLSQAT